MQNLTRKPVCTCQMHLKLAIHLHFCPFIYYFCFFCLFGVCFVLFAFVLHALSPRLCSSHVFTVRFYFFSPFRSNGRMGETKHGTYTGNKRKSHMKKQHLFNCSFMQLLLYYHQSLYMLLYIQRKLQIYNISNICRYIHLLSIILLLVQF